MAATDILGEADAAHLLRRAGFGGTPKEIVKLARKRRVDAVQDLVLTKSAKNRPPASRRNDDKGLARMQRWWLKRMSHPKWRLHEKLALFWHDHFATSFDVVEDLRQMAVQNQTFRRYGMDGFRNLVWRVTRDPAMLEFLDGRRNRRGRPNENYARELMELFCLGVTDRAGVENYDQSDVIELARALTGYVVDRDEGRLEPRRFDADDKVLFAGTPFEKRGNLGVEDSDGNLLPPDRNVIDAMFDHTDSDGRPTCARFIAEKLWTWFVFPDPPQPIVDELADVFRGSGYVTRSLVGAILTHDAFYSDEARTSSPKSPVEYVVQTLRTFGVKTRLTDTPDELRDMGMELFNPPGVNGWNHGPAWLSAGRYLTRIEFAQAVASGRSPRTYRTRPEKLIGKKVREATAVVDALVERLHCDVPDAARAVIAQYVAEGDGLEQSELSEIKYRGALVLIASLPEFQVH